MKRAKSNSWIPDVIALLTLGAIVALYFFRLFYPQQQLIVTPDFGHSDAWHFSFVTKWYFGNLLHQGHLPLWTSLIGTGFPLLAEGQTGPFFLPNILLYTLFSPVTAYNMSFIVVIMTAAAGMYLWLRLLKTPRIVSLILALTFAFSGLTMTQLSHITLLQGLTLLPLLMSITHLLAYKKKLMWALILGLGFSQQLLTGYPQAVCITVLFSGLYYLWCLKEKKLDFISILLFSIAITVALPLSSVQLLPSFEFLQQSTSPKGFSVEVASQFSFPWKHLSTFFNPFALGNPKMNTYPPFAASTGDIFWENSGYSGVILLFFVLVPFVVRKKSTIAQFLGIALGLSLILMTGKYSPLYFVYSFWPFTLFRVPSRFIWVFVMMLVSLTAVGIQPLMQKGKWYARLIVLLLVANIGIVLSSYWSYSAIAPASRWLDPPTLTKVIQPRVYTIGAVVPYDKTFFSTGWQDMQPYVFYRNFFDPNQNMYWNIPHADMYAGRFLYRTALFTNLLNNQLNVTASMATPSAIAEKLLDMAGVNTLVSSVPIDTPVWREEASVIHEKTTIYAYRALQPHTRAYIATRTHIAKTRDEAMRILADETFDSHHSVVLETPIDLPKTETPNDPNITLIEDTQTTVRFSVSNLTHDGLFVLKDTVYPGWKAWIDETSVPIYPANIMHRAIRIPAGNHSVTFRYQPESFQKGARISIVAHIIVGALMAFLMISSAVGTAQTMQSPDPRHPRNHGTS